MPCAARPWPLASPQRWVNASGVPCRAGFIRLHAHSALVFKAVEGIDGCLLMLTGCAVALQAAGDNGAAPGPIELSELTAVGPLDG